MKRWLLKIIRHYGLRNQLKKLHEEIYELSEAILDERSTYYHEHITEEFADVQVLLSQIKEYFDLDDKEIKQFFDYKVERQIKRMENGK